MRRHPTVSVSVAALAGALWYATAASAATVCEQRARARELRDDMRCGEALLALEAVDLQASSATDEAAVRLDRAEVLLDLWRVPEAVAEITAVSSLLQGTEPQEGSCGETASEASVRALELGARAPRVEGNYTAAAHGWRIALARRRSQQPPDAAALVRALNVAGEAFSLAGDLDEMERLYLEAVTRAEAIDPPDELLVARAIEGIGMLASARGEFERAEASYQRALELYRSARGDSHPILAGLWLSIGSMAADRADLLTADAAYQQAAAILGPLSDPSLASDQAALALNLGLMDARLGRVDSARENFATARELWTSTRGPDHPHLAWVDESLSDLLADAGRLDEADAPLAQAVRQRERSMPDSPIAVLTAARLAALRARAGKVPEAKSLWRQVDDGAALLPTAGGLFHASLAARRAESAEALGDVVGAARLRAEVEALLARQLPAGHPGLAEARGQRARLAWLRAQPRQALRFATDAWRVQRRVMAETISTLPESDGLRYVERSRDLRDLLLCAAVNAPPGSTSPASTDDVMRELAASRGLISGALYARNRVVLAASASPARDEASDALTLARRRYASLLWQPVASADADYAAALAKARRDLEVEERARARHRPDPASSPTADPDAWKALGPRDALVAFGRYRCPANPTRQKTETAGASGYVAFVRTAARPARIVRFPDGAALDRAVGDWYASITGAVYAAPTEAQDEEVDARGRALSKALWAPLAAAIGNAERVFIVPDGALHSVSWYALPGVSRPYLIDEPRVLHVLTAESDLVAAAVPGATGDKRAVVVLADPLVARASTAVADAALGAETRQLRSACRFVDPQRLPRLDEAVDEARDVQQQARAADRPVQLATGAAASESWLRDHAPGASILHLAAHGGLLSPESCREPTGVAEEPAAARVRTLWEEAVRARPLMRSGLLLTGAAGFTPLDAPGTNDDGVLVAEEAARLDLRGADWVVLSACSTRRGPVVDAEGSLGLHRAFHSAGARTVIASLWDVQDAPARRFMRALYAARLGEGRTTADAMRQAERTVLEELRWAGRSTHPVQWAAFVASGDWR